MTGSPPIAGSTRITASPTGLSERRASGGAHPPGDGQQGALRQPRFYAPYRRHPQRRERRDAELSLSARGKSAVPVPLPLDRERDRVLGQPLRPAPRDVGLLAAHPRRHPRDGEGRTAGVRQVASRGYTFRAINSTGAMRPAATFWIMFCILSGAFLPIKT